MALDFGNYLLSSSPPGFEYIRLKSFDFRQDKNGELYSCHNGFVDHVENGVNGFHKINLYLNENREINEANKTRWQSYELEDDRTKVPNRKPTDNIRISDWANCYECDPENCSCNSTKATKRKRKNVVFADDCGQSLTQVRVMQEPSDVPPELHSEVLCQLDLTLDNSVSSNMDATQPLLINFAQPAADYVAFREKLEKGFVSLENALSKDNQLVGTIKVKNVSFNKRVTVRCTFDGWESHQDFAASYSNSGNALFDTFSFQIHVPQNTKSGKSIQFAICYTADGAEYWDNNEGKNYEVLRNDNNKERCQNGVTQTVFAMDRRDAWSDFSGWSEEHDDPYW